MKPKTDLLLNSACILVISPLLGMMVVSFIVGLVEILMWTVAGTAGLISSVFFDVDFTAIKSCMTIIRQIEALNPSRIIDNTFIHEYRNGFIKSLSSSIESLIHFPNSFSVNHGHGL